MELKMTKIGLSFSNKQVKVRKFSRHIYRTKNVTEGTYPPPPSVRIGLKELTCGTFERHQVIRYLPN